MVNRRIRVNPEGLRETAGLLREKQDRLAALEKDLLASAGDAPSYEGQFGPKVRALASEGSASLRAVSGDVGRAIEELERIADNFEAADRESQEQIERFSTGILSYLDGLMALLAQLLPAREPPYQLRLDYTLEEFQRMSAEERIAWVEAFNDGPGDGWFSNFEDILYYLRDSKVFTGLDGSTAASQWMASADAAVLQVVQDGYVLFRNPDAILPKLPDDTPPEIAQQRTRAAQLWAGFFVQHLRTRDEIIAVGPPWGTAEQAGVNYGEALANEQLARAGVEIPEDEREFIDVFVRFGDVYRTTIANNLGEAAFETAPSILGGKIGEYVGESLKASTREGISTFSSLVTMFGFEVSPATVNSIGDSLVGEGSLFDRVTDAFEPAGDVIGSELGDLVEEPLGEVGGWFFDPRTDIGVEFDAPTPFGPVAVDLSLRGPAYHMSMSVETMMLEGDKDLVYAFLEAVEETIEEAGGTLLE